MLSRQVIGAEVQRFCEERRSLIALPVACASAIAALWPYMPHWTVPVTIGTFLILEPSFNNILFRSPKEFELLAIAPVSWKTVVLSKNCAAAFLACCIAVFLSIPSGYILSDIPTGSQVLKGVGLLSTVLFPMLMAGNARSVKAPRRRAGLGIADAAEAIITVTILGAASLPYLLFSTLPNQWWPVTLYVLAVGAVWFFISVPTTAKAIERHRTQISLTA
jgi:hypothetical protein